MEQNGIPKKFPTNSHSDRPWGSPKENPAAPAVAHVAPLGPGALAPRRGASGATDESAAAGGGGGEGPGAQTGHRLTHGEPGGSSIGRHQIR